MKMFNFINIITVIVVCLQLAYGSCPSGYYRVILNNGIIICRDCRQRVTCPKSMGVTTYIACGDVVPVDTKVHCIDCVVGKNFSSYHDMELCQPCLLCHPHEATDGECTVQLDTTICKGFCAKGFYPAKNSSVENCTACSKCYGKNPLRIEKCLDDNMPIEMQCEHTELSPTWPTVMTMEKHSTTLSTDNDDDEFKSKQSGYNLYKTLFICAMTVIGLFSFFSVYCWIKKCRRVKYTNYVTSSSDDVPLPDRVVTVECGHDVVKVDASTETDKVAELNMTRPSTTLRKRSNSGADRRVSFSEQNSIAEHDILEEGESSRNKILDNTRQNMSFLTVPEERERSRTLSTGSGKSFSGVFRRQNSNPGPENKEKKGLVKKSKTFSSFTSLMSKDPKGSAEEMQPMLPADSLEDEENNNEPPSLETVILEGKISLKQEKNLKRPPIINIANLNAGVHQQMCFKLNLTNDGLDWRTLAGKMGYTIEDVQTMKQNGEPTECLLTHWGTQPGNDVTRLIRLLSEIGRSDVIELLN